MDYRRYFNKTKFFIDIVEYNFLKILKYKVILTSKSNFDDIITNTPFYWLPEYNKPIILVGNPQYVLIRLIEENKIINPVLIIGLNNIDNIYTLAKNGYDLTVIDKNEDLFNSVKNNREEYNKSVNFILEDPLKLKDFSKNFNTIIDFGFLHNLKEEDDVLYALIMSNLLSASGTLFLLCYSNKDYGGIKPRRFSREKIYIVFKDGFEVKNIEESVFQTKFGNISAWLATIVKERKI